jgi:DNA modification methylase
MIMKVDTIIQGDCLEVMREMESNSVDAIVSDPPYGISFMSKKWDYDVPSVEIWTEALRVLKHGGHLLSFSGTRTYHRMAVNIEDAGFEIRDMIAWVYGSGFPKSHNISKAMDKMAGAEREVIGASKVNGLANNKNLNDDNWSKIGDKTFSITKSSTPKAIQWEGYGTAIKPAQEPIVLARKPLSEKTIALNVLKHGVGGINIDGCRIGTEEHLGRDIYQTQSTLNASTKGVGSVNEDWKQGRFPANFIHDGSQEVLDLFPDTKTGDCKTNKMGGVFGNGKTITNPTKGDSGSAARYFYCAKASKRDRDEGLEDMELRQTNDGRKDQTSIDNPHQSGITNRHNFHPTVKPTKLMQYLVRLVTPPNGIVLDPFGGSGSTGKACIREGFRYILIERDEEYCEIARQRLGANNKGLSN